jgi:chromosomal replication initiation ATPase DnaA
MLHIPDPAIVQPDQTLDISALQQSVCQWIIIRVAADFGLDPGELTATTRGSPRAAFARQVAMYLAHVGFALSFEAVGQNFGRDRTTVSHACRVVEDSRDDVWLDCRLAVLERACFAELDQARRGALR